MEIEQSFGEKNMKIILMLMLWGSLTAQNLLMVKAYNLSNKGSQYPKLINELNLDKLNHCNEVGRIKVKFDVSSSGKVQKAIIIDTFNIKFNAAVIDAVERLKFIPAKQNGRAMQVSYSLPIVLK